MASDPVVHDLEKYKPDGVEAPRIELMKETQAFLQELFDAEILLPAEQEGETDPALIFDESVPFEVSGDHAEQLASRLRELIDRERAGIHEDHPLVKCAHCGEVATHCEFGNSYCPSCGESLDDATEVVKEGERDGEESRPA